METVQREVALIAPSKEPVTTEEALHGPERDTWMPAMAEELEQLCARGTFELVEPPSDAVKAKPDLLLKASLNNPVWILTRRMPQRPILSLSVLFWLNSTLDETIYIKQPVGFLEPGKEDHVWLLKKALYGLKQSGRLWYMTLKRMFTDVGYSCSKIDPEIFFNFGSTKTVAMHVDDSTLVGDSERTVVEMKAELSRQYEIADLNIVPNGVHRNPAQTEDASPLSTPLEPGLPLSKVQCPRAHDKTRYFLRRHSTCPFHVESRSHSVGRYGMESSVLIGYTDNDWGSQDNRHSISRYAGAVAWSSKKQPLVAL